jgi:hypothetical protein
VWRPANDTALPAPGVSILRSSTVTASNVRAAGCRDDESLGPFLKGRKGVLASGSRLRAHDLLEDATC